MRTSLQDKIYKHYSSEMSWLGLDSESVEAGSIFRNLHIIARKLKRWHIGTRQMKLGDFVACIDREETHLEIKERCRWVLDSAVGDLLVVVEKAQSFEDDVVLRAEVPKIILDACSEMPSLAELFSSRILTGEWIKCVKGLIASFQLCDRQLRRYERNVYRIRSLLLQGYLLTSRLHQVLPVVDYLVALH
jgi:hypothetical protein